MNDRHARRHRIELGAAAVAACAPMPPAVCPRRGALTPRARLRDARRDAHPCCVHVWQTLVGSRLLWHGLMMAGATSTRTSSRCYHNPNVVRALALLTSASANISRHIHVLVPLVRVCSENIQAASLMLSTGSWRRRPRPRRSHSCFAPPSPAWEAAACCRRPLAAPVHCDVAMCRVWPRVRHGHADSDACACGAFAAPHARTTHASRTSLYVVPQCVVVPCGVLCSMCASWTAGLGISTVVAN